MAQIQEFPKCRCPHPIGRYLLVGGHLKWPQCFRQIELVTDANVATEVARREATARTKGVPFSMDKVIFHHPRRAQMSQKDSIGTREALGIWLIGCNVILSSSLIPQTKTRHRRH